MSKTRSDDHNLLVSKRGCNFIKFIGCFLLQSGCYMTVRIEGDTDAGVTQPLLDYLRVYPLFEQD